MDRNMRAVLSALSELVGASKVGDEQTAAGAAQMLVDYCASTETARVIIRLVGYCLAHGLDIRHVAAIGPVLIDGEGSWPVGPPPPRDWRLAERGGDDG